MRYKLNINIFQLNNFIFNFFAKTLSCRSQWFADAVHSNAFQLNVDNAQDLPYVLSLYLERMRGRSDRKRKDKHIVR